MAELGSRPDKPAGKHDMPFYAAFAEQTRKQNLKGQNYDEYIKSFVTVADWRGAGGGHRSGSGGRGADGGAARRPERERSPGKHDVIGRRAHYDGPPKYESILFFLF